MYLVKTLDIRALYLPNLPGNLIVSSGQLYLWNRWCHWKSRWWCQILYLLINREVMTPPPSSFAIAPHFLANLYIFPVTISVRVWFWVSKTLLFSFYHHGSTYEVSILWLLLHYLNNQDQHSVYVLPYHMYMYVPSTKSCCGQSGLDFFS